MGGRWHRVARVMAAAAILGGILFTGATASAGGGQAEIEVVATGLDNPRGLAIGPDGALYVAESGRGGEGPCIPGPEGGEVCFGLTGAVTRIWAGSQERIVEGLPSIAGHEGMAAIGPSAVAVPNQTEMFTLIGLGADPAKRDLLGPFGSGLGTIVQFWPNGAHEYLADIAAYETLANPDGGAIDSNPYAWAGDESGTAIVDAGANALYWLDNDGFISTLAVFPGFEAAPPPFLNLPPGARIPVQPVPDSVAIGPDGAFYVGELTGFPFVPGAAKVWRVVPGYEPEVFATGFTNIIDLDFGPDGSLYVLEIAKGGLLPVLTGQGGDPTGRLVRVYPDGWQEDVASDGLVTPGGLLVDHDGTIYISNFSVMAGLGQVVRIAPQP